MYGLLRKLTEQSLDFSQVISSQGKILELRLLFQNLSSWSCSIQSSFLGGGHALVGRMYLGANAVYKVEVMILEVQVEMGSWEKLRIVGMW